MGIKMNNGKPTNQEYQWEKINNPEAIRYYKQRQFDRKNLTPDTAWYRKWVGPFTMFDREKLSKTLITSLNNLKESDLFYDTTGYVIVPQRVLQ